MTATAVPEAKVSFLHKPDGSAHYSYKGYSIVAAVNGPVEAQRRDEDPEEATVDVVVRPAAGVGGTRERHLESLLQATLRPLILVKNLPRALVQVVLQIVTTPEDDYVNTKIVQANKNLPVLPSLIQASVLALLSSAVPMRTIATATSVVVLPDATLVVDPSPRELSQARSLHVLAFTTISQEREEGDLLLVESEGGFTLQELKAVLEKGRRACCQAGFVGQQMQLGLDLVLDDADKSEDATDMRQFIRGTIEARVAADLYWK